MSDIPAARELVAAAHQKIETRNREAADLLARAEQMMWCDKPGKPRAPVEAKMIAPELRAAILDYHYLHPRASILKLAKIFKTGTGRVSEVINGKR